MNKLKGIALTAFSTLLIAVLFAFFFRLPIPMGGVIGPLGEYNSNDNIVEILKMVITAWVFYGLFGGFILIALFGSIAGYLAGKFSDASKSEYMTILKYSFIAGLMPVLFISTLDLIIGPW